MVLPAPLLSFYCGCIIPPLILYFGAAFTRGYAICSGSHIYPNNYAVWVEQVEVESKKSLAENSGCVKSGQIIPRAFSGNERTINPDCYFYTTELSSHKSLT